MSEPNVLESLPDRAMKESEIDSLRESDSIDWLEVLMTGSPKRQKTMVSAWALESGGTVYVLLYEIDGWVSQGSFDAEGLSDEEKSERAEEILDF